MASPHTGQQTFSRTASSAQHDTYQQQSQHLQEDFNSNQWQSTHEISGRRESTVYRETKIISSAINGTRAFKRSHVGGRNNIETGPKRDSTHRSRRSIAAVNVAEDKGSQALDPESDDETTYSHVEQKEQEKQNDKKYKQERVKNKYKASAKDSKDVKRDQLLSTLRYFAGRPK